MGASGLKDSYKMEDLHKLESGEQEMPEDELEDAVCPVYLVKLGSWWFTRGIEASAAKRRDIRMDMKRQEAAWNLSASKRDPRALGKERAHGCLCAELERSSLCPFHSMVDWLVYLRKRFPAPDGSDEEDELPPIPE